MTADEHISEQLWELVYGLLSDEDAADLQVRISTDPELARAYATVQLQADLLADAARLDEPEADLVGNGKSAPSQESEAATAEQDSVFVKPRGSPLTARLRPLLALAATLVFGMASYSVLRHEPVGELAAVAPDVEHFTSMILPDELRREINNPVIVSVQGQLAPTNFDVRVYDSQDRLRLQRQTETDAAGLSRVDLPGNELPDHGRIELVPLDGVTRGVTADFSVKSANALTYMSVDKSFYRPGEKLEFRSVTLPRFNSGKPSNEDLIVELQDAIGNPVDGAVKTLRAENGVANGSIEIPADAVEGSYQLVTRSATEGARHPIDVRSTRELLAMETSQEPQLAGPQVNVDFYPEGGELVAGVYNRVFFRARDTAGEPLELSGEVVDQEQRVLAEVQTQHRGRGSFTLRPEIGQIYSFSPTESGLAGTFRVPQAQPGGVAVQVSRGVFSEQTPIEIELRSERPRESLVLAASCQQAVVGLEKFAIEESHRTEDGQYVVRRQVPVVPETNGVIQLTLFDAATSPPQALANRSVFFRPRQEIEVRVELAQRDYQPGQRITLTLVTTDEHGSPQSAILGGSLSVALAAQESSRIRVPDDSQVTRSLPTFYYLADQLAEASLVEADCDWAATADPEQSLDFLLATQTFATDRIEAAEPASNGLPIVAPSKIAGGGDFVEKETVNSRTANNRAISELAASDRTIGGQAVSRRRDEATGIALAAGTNFSLPKIVVSNSSRVASRASKKISQTGIWTAISRLAPAAIVASLLLGLLLILDAALPVIGRRTALVSLAGVGLAVLVAGSYWMTPTSRPTASVANAVLSERAATHASKAETVERAVVADSAQTLTEADSLHIAEEKASAEGTAALGIEPESPARSARPAAEGLPAAVTTEELLRQQKNVSNFADTSADVESRLGRTRQFGEALTIPAPLAGGDDLNGKQKKQAAGSVGEVGIGRAAGQVEQATDGMFRQVLQLQSANSQTAAFGSGGSTADRQRVLITDSSGRATLTIQLPAEPAVLRLRLDAYSSGRLGSIERSIVVGQP